MASILKIDDSNRVDIVCRRGDTLSFSVNILDENSLPIDISAYDWSIEVKREDDLSTNVISSTSFFFNGSSSGVLEVVCTATTMGSVAAGDYVYDLQSTSASVVKTWMYGLFKVNQDITD
jgi:hypothetical protein